MLAYRYIIKLASKGKGRHVTRHGTANEELEILLGVALGTLMHADQDSETLERGSASLELVKLSVMPVI